IVTTPSDCAARQGAYRGDNTVCTSTTCPHPPAHGACCITDGKGVVPCQVLAAADCTTAGGSYRGDNTSCGGDICAPRGACCNPQLSTNASNCVVTTQAV